MLELSVCFGFEQWRVILIDQLLHGADDGVKRWGAEHWPRHPHPLLAHHAPMQNALVSPIAQYLHIHKFINQNLWYYESREEERKNKEKPIERNLVTSRWSPIWTMIAFGM